MIAAISLNSQTFLGHNRAVYQELRAALQIPLRRQLLIAVCDDGGLQEQLAQRLEADLSPDWATEPEGADSSPLVMLRLDSHHPDLVREVLLWLKRQRRLGGNPGMIPAFQILGVETLTRQSPTIQNRFLASLIRVDALLTQLDCRLLVWVPRPWLGKIQQVVPGFWRSRNGLYEFAGEPALTAPSPQPNRSPSAGSSPPGAVQLVASPSRPGESAIAPNDADVIPSALPAALAAHDQIPPLRQHIQALHQQQAGPLTLGRAYLALGQICRDQGTAGDVEVLEFTLVVYQRAVDGLPQGDPDWCEALDEVGDLSWMRAQLEHQPEAMEVWLQRSVAAYRRAIEGQTQAAPDTLGHWYGRLGRSYGLLANLTDPQANLEQAVMAYTQALHYTPAALAPLNYANDQNSLGAIHWRLAQLDRPRYHLHRAIVAYQEALSHRIPQAEPQEYAMLQNNLGIAYWSLAQHESPIPRLEQAIDAYQTALVYRTLATTPAGCATTQNNLGTAYWDLAQQQTHQPAERLLSLGQAADAYEAALDAMDHALQQAPTEPPGFDVWATCHSVGIVHDQLALTLPADPQGQREHHLNAALGHYLLAYQGWQDQPEQLEVLATALVYSVRLHFEILGLTGQQAVLSKLPPELLGRVLPRL